jgi:hypothetical protein
MNNRYVVYDEADLLLPDFATVFYVPEFNFLVLTTEFVASGTKRNLLDEDGAVLASAVCIGEL